MASLKTFAFPISQNVLWLLMASILGTTETTSYSAGARQHQNHWSSFKHRVCVSISHHPLSCHKPPECGPPEAQGPVWNPPSSDFNENPLCMHNTTQEPKSWNLKHNQFLAAPLFSCWCQSLAFKICHFLLFSLPASCPPSLSFSHNLLCNRWAFQQGAASSLRRGGALLEQQWHLVPTEPEKHILSTPRGGDEGVRSTLFVFKQWRIQGTRSKESLSLITFQALSVLMNTSYLNHLQYSMGIMRIAQYYCEFHQFHVFKVIMGTDGILIRNVHPF